MKADVITQITIKAKPADVFKYLENLEYHYLWNPQIQDIKPIIKLKLHSTYETSSQILGVKINAVNEVSKFVPSKELELVNNTGMVKYTANFKLRPNGSKTTLVCDTTVASESNAFAFAKPVLKMLARRELQTDLRALKVAVEGRLK
jgi:carbon monoxide dehydrogenase subunit G